MSNQVRQCIRQISDGIYLIKPPQIESSFIISDYFLLATVALVYIIQYGDIKPGIYSYSSCFVNQSLVSLLRPGEDPQTCNSRENVSCATLSMTP